MTAHAHTAWDQHQLDPIDMITELVDRHRHREHYTLDGHVNGYRLGRDHVVEAPPLLAQLEQATPTSAGGETEGGGGFKSQPAAHLESVDTLIQVDKEASRYVREHGDDDAGMSTRECVRRVGALMASMDRCHRHRGLRTAGRIACCQWHAVEHDVRRWWAQARIVAGWDSPAWRPDATCPLCGERGGLRVRLSAKAGICTECRETWDPSSIGLLADHIRAETFAGRADRRPVACGRLDDWEPEDLGVLCPKCGSSRCQRALAARLVAAAS